MFLCVLFSLSFSYSFPLSPPLSFSLLLPLDLLHWFRLSFGAPSHLRTPSTLTQYIFLLRGMWRKMFLLGGKEVFALREKFFPLFFLVRKMSVFISFTSSEFKANNVISLCWKNYLNTKHSFVTTSCSSRLRGDFLATYTRTIISISAWIEYICFSE